MTARRNGAEIGSGSLAGAVGQQMWARARRVIAGGGHLLSKRPDMFAPGQWPAYFSRARGAEVWDLEGRRFADFSLMSVGTNTLGYGDPVVDAAVRHVTETGNMSTLMAPEEVLLAERLVDMHAWADKARFARSGGEANAVAIRLGRAASGRDGVAISGYHGWHDWYLAANLGGDDALDGHLLPGLDPAGVPRALAGTIHPFRHGDLAALERILALGDVGVIKMEVARSGEPDRAFLAGARDLASRHGAVLIFDECTSGFRQTFGGLHLQTGVTPDLAVFGKALGNGYAITGVLGCDAVMEAAQTSFISSTFWTERLGPAAALATLDEMERRRSWDAIAQTGREVKAAWSAMAAAHGLEITIGGLAALATFSLGPASQAAPIKTFIVQEMLRRGHLAGPALYVCTEHPPLVEAYLAALDEVFGLIAACLLRGDPVESLLEGPVASTGFARLT